MKILMLVHNLPERGSYFRCAEIAARLVLRGHYVEFICIAEKNKFRPRYSAVPANEITRHSSHDHLVRQRPAVSTGQILSLHSPYRTFFNDRQEGWSAFDSATRLREALREKWDLVYGFSHKPDCVLPALAAKVRGAKIVLDWSDWWGTSEGIFRYCVLGSNSFQSLPLTWRAVRRITFAVEEFIEPLVYRLADAVTLISDEYLRHSRAPRDLADKSYIMHSGAPLNEIRPEDKIAARHYCQLTFPDNSVVLGYVANYHMSERMLLEAFAEVCAKHDNIYLLVIGGDFESTDPAVHEVIKHRVRHVGRKPFSEMTKYLGAADILLLPLMDVALDRARYPHKLSDYVASGRPIVACDVGVAGSLLREYEIGELTLPTVSAFAHGIESLVSRPDEWDEMGKRTRAVAEKHFEWGAISDSLFDFLSKRLGLNL